MRVALEWMAISGGDTQLEASGFGPGRRSNETTQDHQNPSFHFHLLHFKVCEFHEPARYHSGPAATGKHAIARHAPAWPCYLPRHTPCCPDSINYRCGSRICKQVTTAAHGKKARSVHVNWRVCPRFDGFAGSQRFYALPPKQAGKTRIRRRRRGGEHSTGEVPIDSQEHCHAGTVQTEPGRFQVRLRIAAQKILDGPATDNGTGCRRFGQIAGDGGRSPGHDQPTLLLVVTDGHRLQTAVVEARQGASQADELPVPVEQVGMQRLPEFLPVEAAAFEGGRILGIGDVPEASRKRQIRPGGLG
jgi:hypothetical protein